MESPSNVSDVCYLILITQAIKIIELIFTVTIYCSRSKIAINPILVSEF